MILFSICHGRWSQQKNAGSGASFALPQRVLQKGVDFICAFLGKSGQYHYQIKVGKY